MSWKELREQEAEECLSRWQAEHEADENERLSRTVRTTMENNMPETDKSTIDPDLIDHLESIGRWECYTDFLREMADLIHICIWDWESKDSPQELEERIYSYNREELRALLLAFVSGAAKQHMATGSDHRP